MIKSGVFFSEYEIEREIGRGSFGSVLQIRRRSTGEVLACKKVNYSNFSDKEKAQLVNEVNTLRKLNHPRVVRYLDRWVDRDNEICYIVMELCSGDLAQVIKKYRNYEGSFIPESTIWSLFSQIVESLQECHSRHILHRDLKPHNVFLSSDMSSIKLGDFGLAKQLSLHGPSELFASSLVGTPLYQAPELLDGQPHSIKTDLWACGCILYELATLSPPFPATSPTQLIHMVRKTDPALPLRSPYSYELTRCVSALLAKDPKMRPSIEMILEWPMVRSQLMLNLANKMMIEIIEKEATLKKRENLLFRKESQFHQQQQNQDQQQHDPKLQSTEQHFSSPSHRLSSCAIDKKTIQDESMSSSLSTASSNMNTAANFYNLTATDNNNVNKQEDREKELETKHNIMEEMKSQIGLFVNNSEDSKACNINNLVVDTINKDICSSTNNGSCNFTRGEIQIKDPNNHRILENYQSFDSSIHSVSLSLPCNPSSKAAARQVRSNASLPPVLPTLAEFSHLYNSHSNNNNIASSNNSHDSVAQVTCHSTTKNKNYSLSPRLLEHLPSSLSLSAAANKNFYFLPCLPSLQLPPFSDTTCDISTTLSIPTLVPLHKQDVEPPVANPNLNHAAAQHATTAPPLILPPPPSSFSTSSLAPANCPPMNHIQTQFAPPSNALSYHAMPAAGGSNIANRCSAPPLLPPLQQYL